MELVACPTVGTTTSEGLKTPHNLIDVQELYERGLLGQHDERERLCQYLRAATKEQIVESLVDFFGRTDESNRVGYFRRLRSLIRCENLQRADWEDIFASQASAAGEVEFRQSVQGLRQLVHGLGQQLTAQEEEIARLDQTTDVALQRLQRSVDARCDAAGRRIDRATQGYCFSWIRQVFGVGVCGSLAWCLIRRLVPWLGNNLFTKSIDAIGGRICT